MRILKRMENRELHLLQFSRGQWKHLCTAKVRAPSPSPQKTLSLSSPPAPPPVTGAFSSDFSLSGSPSTSHPRASSTCLRKLVVLTVFTKFIYVHISGSFVHFVLKLLILEPLRMCVYWLISSGNHMKSNINNDKYHPHDIFHDCDSAARKSTLHINMQNEDSSW